MATLDFSKFVIYRWRYIIGYTAVGLLLAGVLLFAGLFLPGALSPEETRATVRSDALSFENPSSFAIANLPYYLLQAGIFELFGVYTFTIKLPSLILALLSAIGLILLLRRWFRPNIAVLASAIAVSTGQFLYVAQNGNPGIMYIFWPVVLLLLGTQVTRGKKYRFLWKLLFSIAAALSLYTPLSVYPLLAILLATLFHPHLRNALRRLKKWKLAVCVSVAMLILLPLIWGVSVNPQLGLTLLGGPMTWPPDITANLMTVLRQYFLFWEPSTTTLMTPVFGLGSVLILGLGLYRLVRTRETTRSYLIIFWVICLIPVILFNPSFTSVTFLPALLLIAAGLTSLIDYWYRLFPRNPYARIAGLVPLTILIAVLIGSGLDRYVNGYHYDPHTATNFSRDLKLIPSNTSQLVVSRDERPFYEAVARHRDNLEVTDAPSAESFVATRDAKKSFTGYDIDRIITTTYAENGDRLYVYKKAQ